jgi:hypothetical protein
MRNGRKLRAAVACGTILSVAIASGAIGVTIKRRARVAADYVASKQDDNGSFLVFSRIGGTADAVQALAAANRGPRAINRALAYLDRRSDDAPGAPNAIDRVGEKAELVIALVAAGRDPSDFGGRDYVDELQDAADVNGRYGDLAQSRTYDQALAILALEAADAEVPTEAFNWLQTAQCGDGGWQFDEPPEPATSNNDCFDPALPSDFTRSDTNTTSLVVQAYVFAPEDANDIDKNPFTYFRSARDPVKRGWVYEAAGKCETANEEGFCYRSDANSTALVIQAHLARDRVLPTGAMKALTNLQYKLCGDDAGAFAFTWMKTDEGLRKDARNLGATTAAIPALMKKPFPLDPANVTKPVPSVGAC